jgi:ribosome-associated protein
LKAEQLARTIADLMLEQKGEKVVIQDLRKITSLTDFFVICSVDVEVQAKAIIEHLKDRLVFQSIKPWHTEGSAGSNWILLDFVDVVVHVFKKESREFYGLERLWGDAPLTEIKESDDAAKTHTDDA